MTGKLWLLAAVPVLVALAAGCGSDTEKVKALSGENSKTSHAIAFAKAFEGGVWSDVKNEEGKNRVQFTGKISQGMHDQAVANLHKSDPKIVFVSACNYFATQNSGGNTPANADFTFDANKLPIRNGTLVSALVDGYFENKNNSDSINQLISYYDKHYWEAGSDVLIQWGVYAGGKIIKIEKITNKFWDADPLFKENSELIMKVIFGYAG